MRRRLNPVSLNFRLVCFFSALGAFCLYLFDNFHLLTTKCWSKTLVINIGMFWTYIFLFFQVFLKSDFLSLIFQLTRVTVSRWRDLAIFIVVHHWPTSITAPNTTRGVLLEGWWHFRHFHLWSFQSISSAFSFFLAECMALLKAAFPSFDVIEQPHFLKLVIEHFHEDDIAFVVDWIDFAPGVDLVEVILAN